MQEQTKIKLEEAKVKATEIAKKHTKAMLKEINAEVLPLCIDAATAEIPGQVDDAIAAVAKPIVQQTLDAAIEAI